MNIGDHLFFKFLRDLQTDNPLVIIKYTKIIKWGWMGFSDATWHIFPEVNKNCWHQQKIHAKCGQTHKIWKQQHNKFPMSGYSSKSDK